MEVPVVPTPTPARSGEDDPGRAPPTGRNVPTGIADFDTLTGGIPLGSVVLLIGEAGAGHQEFALTSAAHLMFHQDLEPLHRFYLGGARGPFAYPRDVAYVSVTRSRDQVLRELQAAFEPSYADVLVRHLNFADLSPTYFSDSVVPSSWAAVPSSLLSGRSVPVGSPTGPLSAVASALESSGPSNLVILDSLTDLVVRKGIDAEELLTLVKGLRRRAKEWDGLVYLLLSKGVAAPEVEHALVDSVDGAFGFAWTSSPLRSSRQRAMLIEKFMPVLSHVPHERQGRFVIRVSALSGLVTTQYERI